VDSGDQADEAWLLGIQRKLYQWSGTNPDDRYGDLWNWITDPRNLRSAWRRIAGNKGSRTAGIDGMTVGSIRATTGEEAFLEHLRDDFAEGPVSTESIPPEAHSEAGQTREIPTPGHSDRA